MISSKQCVKEIKQSLKLFNKKKKYLLHEPFLDKSDSTQINKCIYSTFVSSVSGYTNIFEKELSKFTGSKYVVAMVTGTAAIEIALKSVGVKKDEEVLIPNANYIASANSTLQIGAIPHFIDIDKSNLGIDINKLSIYLKKITLIKNGKLINKKTKRIISAIMPTHIFGNTCDVLKLLNLTKKFKIKIIEDSSEALGSFYKNKHLGTFGKVGILSFNGNKIMTTGAGGALLTDDKKIFDKALHLSKISRKQNNYWEYDYSQLGHNYRMPGINAALGISQLKKVKKILKIKKKIYNIYTRAFKNSKNISLIKENKNCNSNNWLNSIYISGCNLKIRNRIINELNKKNIFVRPLWKLMHKISYLKKYPKMSISNSIIVEKSLISLPSSTNLKN
jgi:perosamine synthetase